MKGIIADRQTSAANSYQYKFIVHLAGGQTPSKDRVLEPHRIASQKSFIPPPPPQWYRTTQRGIPVALNTHFLGVETFQWS